MSDRSMSNALIRMLDDIGYFILLSHVDKRLRSIILRRRPYRNGARPSSRPCWIECSRLQNETTTNQEWETEEKNILSTILSSNSFDWKFTWPRDEKLDLCFVFRIRFMWIRWRRSVCVPFDDVWSWLASRTCEYNAAEYCAQSKSSARVREN